MELRMSTLFINKISSCHKLCQTGRQLVSHSACRMTWEGQAACFKPRRNPLAPLCALVPPPWTFGGVPLKLLYRYSQGWGHEALGASVHLIRTSSIYSYVLWRLLRLEPQRPSLILIWGWGNYTLLFQAESWLSLKEVALSCCGLRTFTIRTNRRSQHFLCQIPAGAVGLSAAFNLPEL